MQTATSGKGEDLLVCCAQCGNDEIELHYRRGTVLAVCGRGHEMPPTKLMPRPECPHCGAPATMRKPDLYDQFGMPTIESAICDGVFYCQQCHREGHVLGEEYSDAVETLVRWDPEEAEL